LIAIRDEEGSEMVKVVKRDGREEGFISEKVVVSCLKAGQLLRPPEG